MLSTWILVDCSGAIPNGASWISRVLFAAASGLIHQMWAGSHNLATSNVWKVIQAAILLGILVQPTPNVTQYTI